MDEATDRCWAFSASGERCEMIAGHDDKHAIVKVWTDEECWKPGQSGVVLPPMVVHDPDLPVEVQHLVPGPPQDEMCFCEHPMHDGPCGVDNGEFTCDCANGIAI